MTEPTTCTVPVEFLRGVIALCTQRGYSPENIEAWSKDDKWVADLWRQAEAALATPQPNQAQVGAVPLTHAQAKALVSRYGNDPLHLVYQVEAAHGIKGGQHAD